MKHSLSWESNRFLGGQDIPRILWNHSPSKVSTTCPYPEPDKYSPWPPPHFMKIHLNIVLP